MIRIGGSCVNKDGGTTDDCVVDEIRFSRDSFGISLDKARHNFKVGKYVIANIDMDDSPHWYPNEVDWRSYCNHVAYNLTLAGATLSNCRLTIENEPMKYHTKEKYAWYINLACDEIKNKRKYHFKIGAGNEEFGLSDARGNMYEYILQNCPLIDYLDIHLQSSLINPETKRVDTNRLNRYANQAKDWAFKYNKRLSCTEANWMDIAKKEGFEDLIKVLNKAEEIGCEDFCVVFIDLYGVQKYRWLSFLYEGKVRSPYWDDFKKIIKAKKPIINLISEEEDMKLEILKLGSKGNQVKWLQEILEIEYGFENEGGCDGIFGVLSEAQVKAYQSANKLLVDGICGKDTIFDLIIKSDDPDYWWKKLLIYMAYEK